MVSYFNAFGCILTTAVILLLLLYGRQYNGTGYYEQIMINSTVPPVVIDRSHNNQLNPKTIGSLKFAQQNSTTIATKTLSTYDSTAAINARVANLREYCRGKPEGVKRTPAFRMGWVSRYGKSLGKVDFWTCFTPKCASTSFSVAVLAATGYITKDDYGIDDNYLNDKWDKGRNNCAIGNKLCLKKWQEMPAQLQSLDAESLITNLFVREPMERLVSAWKDKIHTDGVEKTGEKQYYYDKYTKHILRRNNPGKILPTKVTDAFKTDFRVTFEQFIKWITDGNSESDEHWTPAYRLCGVCDVRYKFIGHSEHFNEDIQVFAKMLNISTELFPPSYDVVNAHAAKHHKHQDVSSTYEMYKPIPHAIRQKLLKLYQADYDIFAYPVPEWLS